MGDYKELGRICERLLSVPPSQWREEGERICTDIRDIRFCLSSRVNKETSFQDSVLVGSDEGAEVVNLRIPVDVRYVKLEVRDISSDRVIDSYEEHEDLPLSLYKTITKGIETLKSEQQKQREDREIAEGRKKLGEILG